MGHCQAWIPVGIQRSGDIMSFNEYNVYDHWRFQTQGRITKCLRKLVVASSFDRHGNLIESRANGPEEGRRCHGPNHVGRCGCIHAERRLLNLHSLVPTSSVPKAILVTFSPCSDCCDLILATASIQRVYYGTLTQHDNSGLLRLLKANIAVIPVTSIL